MIKRGPTWVDEEGVFHTEMSGPPTSGPPELPKLKKIGLKCTFCHRETAWIYSYEMFHGNEDVKRWGNEIREVIDLIIRGQANHTPAFNEIAFQERTEAITRLKELYSEIYYISGP